MPSSKVVRAIKAFENAVRERAYASLNSKIDNEEWLIFEHNYVKARAKLERLMENVL